MHKPVKDTQRHLSSGANLDRESRAAPSRRSLKEIVAGVQESQRAAVVSAGDSQDGNPALASALERRLIQSIYQDVLREGLTPLDAVTVEAYLDQVCRLQHSLNSELSRCCQQWQRAFRTLVSLTVHCSSLNATRDRSRVEELVDVLVEELRLPARADDLLGESSAMVPAQLNELLRQKPFRALQERVADEAWNASQRLAQCVLASLRGDLLGDAEVYGKTAVARLRVVWRSLPTSGASSPGQSARIELFNALMLTPEEARAESLLSEEALVWLCETLPGWLQPEVRIVEGSTRMPPALPPGFVLSPFVLLGPFLLARAVPVSTATKSRTNEAEGGLFSRLRGLFGGGG